ncbi:MAG: Maf family protein [Pyrinomonadaceae bacterium]
MINLPKLVLASSSPRRAEILKAVGWKFTKDAADIDEAILPDETPEDYVKRLAREKAEAVAEKYETAIVLGADTTVVIDNQIVGKPVDLHDARRMLEMLAGNWHEVLTGIAIVKVQSLKSRVQSQKTIVDLERTRVKFAGMNREEIEFLVEHGAPLDKAGAYAVQAQAALFIKKIEGDYWNVVGLPVNLVYRMIQTADRNKKDEPF